VKACEATEAADDELVDAAAPDALQEPLKRRAILGYAGDVDVVEAVAGRKIKLGGARGCTLVV